MNICDFDLERGNSTENKHLSIEQLKSLSNYEKIKKEIEKTPIKETISDSLDLVLAKNKKLVKHCNRLREYCITSANTFDKCLEYETEIKNLKKENHSLKKNTKFKKLYKNIFHILESSFNIPKQKILKFLVKNEKSK